MTITDLITLVLTIYFWARGSSRGFMNSLINPFSIIVTTILSIIYYQATKNMIVSMVIGTIGPLLLNLLLKFLLRSWAKATHTDIKPDLMSRLGGSALTIIWGWMFIILGLVLLALIPPTWCKALSGLHTDVTRSISYSRIAQPLGNTLLSAFSTNDPALSNKVSTVVSVASAQNTPDIASASPGPDATSLAQDPRFQKVLQDPDVQSEIKAHDIVKLMSNPKMMALTQQIMTDPATMQKVMALYKAQAKPPSDSDPQDGQSPSSTDTNTSN